MKKNYRKKLDNKREKALIYLIISIVFICFIFFLYNLVFEKNVKYSKDLETSLEFSELPSDILIKDYDEYKAFINKYLSNEEYLEEVKSSDITYDLFDKYDFVAVFYESRICDDTTSVTSIYTHKDKIVVTVKRNENKECDLETRILLIPIQKDKYDEVPMIVIKKEIIAK